MNKEQIIKKLQEVQEITRFIMSKDANGLLSPEVDFSDFNPEDPDDWLLQEEVDLIFYKLLDLYDSIHYIQSPVKYEGILSYDNVRKKFKLNELEIPNGTELEIQILDEFDNKLKWAKTRLEKDGSRYCFGGYEKYSLENRRIRIRE